MSSSSQILNYLRHIPTILYKCLEFLIISVCYPFLSKEGLKTLRIFFKTLPRDLGCIKLGIVSSSEVFYNKLTSQNTVKAFESRVAKHPEKPCFIFGEEVWTFRDMEEFSIRTANLFHKEGLKKGDVVSLMMTNRPEFVGLWLGLARLGVVTSFINTNLKQSSLLHSINITKSKAIIVSADLGQVVESVRSELPDEIKIHRFDREGTENGVKFLKELILEQPTEKYYPEVELNVGDHVVYIFTSGTTGLPKAAIYPHSRMLLIGTFVKYLLGTRADDVVYNPLPMYHTAGGIMGVCMSILNGSTNVIRTKFSASNYIKDCIKYKCTVGQYIGEICRFMLATEPQVHDKLHNLRLMAGNGLRPSIWKKFTDRFGVTDMREIYGSTEGNVTFVNMDGKVGAVGYLPRFLPFTKFMGTIVKMDRETNELIRGEDGLCIPCKIGEPGMMVGVIAWKHSMKDFHGYLDKAECKKKYVYNVFKKGDKAFLTGDLMVVDEEGYLFFKDRVGDTFRWKGENVATSEVESVISSVIGLRDCSVYGVQVGDFEGRAGMATIVDPSGDIDIEAIAKKINDALPRFAQPLFIRIKKEVDMTGTFKLRKVTLQKEGFNPETVSDTLYFKKGPSYTPLTKQLYDQIINGSLMI